MNTHHHRAIYTIPRSQHLSLALLILTLPLLASCGGNSGALWGPGSSQGNTITQPITDQGGVIILASPTLQFVLPALADAFFTARKQQVPFVFDFSGAKVIANTAYTATDADLLITDSQTTMTQSRTLGFTRSDGLPLATDTLTVVLPPTNPGKVTSLQNLAMPGLRYLGISANDGLNEHILATLESMLQDSAFGPHYAARVYGNLVANYTSGLAAGQALATPTPTGDFSIIYRTNYLHIQREGGANSILALPTPAQFNPPIQMLAAITAQARNLAFDQHFLDFLHSPQAAPIWTQFGFVPVS